METIDFRLADPMDEKGLMVLMEAFTDFFGYDFNKASRQKALAQFIQHPQLGHLWVVRCGEDLVGYLALTAGFTFDHGGKDAFIDELYLAESFRNKGIGKQLMEHVEIEAKQLGYRALYLEVEEDNSQAKKLYEQMGFEATGRQLLQKALY